eukprot:TRINITY_DN3146_c0_g1_i1.p3 TRINITY_DN3146_c0_g1~~TRINITY_DN3146_c0_g1_i1.p3  ORF type:complete len:106 (-),score=38.31 TRINITY_DN3146_c0_g1_i1:10-294(-)
MCIRDRKNDSLKTILSVANTMVGSSLVFFPGVFQTNGILTSVIVMIIIAIASCQTCKLLVFHFKQTEGDLSDTCLLYTSPSPRDVEESRMPSSA